MVHLALKKNSHEEIVVTKSFCLMAEDIEHIRLLKNKFINQKIALSDSGIVRIALESLIKLNDQALLRAYKETKKISVGRKKNIDK